MWSNYVIDSGATLLKAGDPQATLDFARNCGRHCSGWLAAALAEIVIVAQVEAGRLPLAARAVNTALRTCSETHHAQVFLFRQAEVLSAMGDHAGALSAYQHLARDLATQAPGPAVNLRLLAHLARELEECDAASAISVARLGVEVADSIRDVVFQQTFLTVLGRREHSAASQRAALDRAEEVARASGYQLPGVRTETHPSAEVVVALHNRVLELGRLIGTGA
jgi:hypothetical protein